MKRKVTWWQALLLVVISLTGIFLSFSSIIDTEQKEKDSKPGDVFAGTKIARVGVSFNFTEDDKPYRDPKLDRHWTTVVQVLDRHGLIERGMEPEVVADPRRNDDLSILVEGTLTASKASWRTRLIIRRDLYVSEGAGWFKTRRVRVAEIMTSGGKAPRAELEMAVVKDLERITEAVASVLSTPLNTPPKNQPYISGHTGSWNLERRYSFIDGPPPRGASIRNPNSPN